MRPVRKKSSINASISQSTWLDTCLVALVYKYNPYNNLLYTSQYSRNFILTNLIPTMTLRERARTMTTISTVMLQRRKLGQNAV